MKRLQRLLEEVAARPSGLTISPEAVAVIEDHLAALAHKRAVKAAQMRRYREKIKEGEAMNILDKTGNQKKRPPPCPVTRAMADAGKAKLDTLTSVDTEDAQVTDDQLVSEVFQAMWAVYWEQVFTLQGKNLKVPAKSVILHPSGLVRQ